MGMDEALGGRKTRRGQGRRRRRRNWRFPLRVWTHSVFFFLDPSTRQELDVSNPFRVKMKEGFVGGQANVVAALRETAAQARALAAGEKKNRQAAGGNQIQACADVGGARGAGRLNGDDIAPRFVGSLRLRGSFIMRH